jgi:hypothetical protein
MNTPADSMPGIDARANHLRTVLENALAEPRFGVTAMREQTICISFHPSFNGKSADKGSSQRRGFRYHEPRIWRTYRPSRLAPTTTPVIITTEEDGQIRAAIVRFSQEDGQQQPGKMQTVFQSSPCELEAEALALLYESSRTAVTGGKHSLEERGLWKRL